MVTCCCSFSPSSSSPPKEAPPPPPNWLLPKPPNPPPPPKAPGPSSSPKLLRSPPKLPPPNESPPKPPLPPKPPPHLEVRLFQTHRHQNCCPHLHRNHLQSCHPCHLCYPQNLRVLVGFHHQTRILPLRRIQDHHDDLHGPRHDLLGRIFPGFPSLRTRHCNTRQSWPGRSSHPGHSCHYCPWPLQDTAARRGRGCCGGP